jgi:polysaccharide biosynthesis transport protein
VKAGAATNARAQKQDHIVGLQTRKASLETTVAFLQERLVQKRGTQREQAGDTLNYEIVKGRLDRAYLFYEQVSARIQEMQAQQRAPARVELLAKAKVPARADEELPFKKMGLVAGAGLAAPFALAVLLELLFRRVSERGQIESTDMNLIGEVTTLPRRISGAGALAMGGRDLQLYEESIDGLRTLLMLFESTRGHKVLSVTSAVSGEGKTSVAAQLAVSIASATNRPTLLIDGDMRSPDVHRIFDVDLGPGLCDVLSGEATAEEAVETGFSEHLHLLTAGNLAASPHRLMGGGKFHDLIGRLREIYEFIIIDTPPILPASEALLMSSAADSAILCVRRDYSRMGQMSEAARRLRSSGVNLAGAVLSGVPVHEYSNRYGAYYYTRTRLAGTPATANTINSNADQAS